jgi:hypothetical protein
MKLTETAKILAGRSILLALAEKCVSHWQQSILKCLSAVEEIGRGQGGRLDPLVICRNGTREVTCVASPH